jgi:hypothetical protein
MVRGPISTSSAVYLHLLNPTIGLGRCRPREHDAVLVALRALDPHGPQIAPTDATPDRLLAHLEDARGRGDRDAGARLHLISRVYLHLTTRLPANSPR